MKIQVIYHDNGCKIEKNGNWYDLKSAEHIKFERFGQAVVSLGLSMNLPRYYQANIVPRSSLGIKKHLVVLNHYGVIDGPNNYNKGYIGNNDIWKCPLFALKATEVNKYERICQFEIRLTQDAPWWAKIRHIFIGRPVFEKVKHFNNESRGGFGSTGGYNK